MSQNNDKQALNNLNNKVDQKRLAYENRLLRWLVAIFAVALLVTMVTYPYVLQQDANVDSGQQLQDYSGSLEQPPTQYSVQRSSNTHYQGRSQQSWTF